MHRAWPYRHPISVRVRGLGLGLGFELGLINNPPPFSARHFERFILEVSPRLLLDLDLVLDFLHLDLQLGLGLVVRDLVLDFLDLDLDILESHRG